MKYALIIGNNKYDDQKLAQLKTPAADSQALAKILGDKTIGAFDEVTPLINQTESRIRRAISTFLTNKKPDDLVLVYFSGHGILDDRGRLYLALKDTQYDLLKATSISSSFVADEMDSCRSKRQILILDCCHSGAFGRGTKGEQKAITETTFEGSGFGRVVLTASDSTQYALEGDQVIKQTELSLFTHFLLEGLKTGEADVNNDGLIALDEWYDYTYGRVVAETPKQVPHKWSYNQQGDLVIAKNPFVKKKVIELPSELLQALESSFVGIRESAVNELGKYLQSRDPEMVALTIASLQKMKGDDSRRISSLAERLLSEFEQTRKPSKATDLIQSMDLTSASETNEITNTKEAPTLQPATEKGNVPVKSPVATRERVFDRSVWLIWSGTTILAIVFSLILYFYALNNLSNQISTQFGAFAGLSGLMQWLVFRKRLESWWAAVNTATGTILGGIHYYLFDTTGWGNEDLGILLVLWLIANFVLGPVLMRNTLPELPSLLPPLPIRSGLNLINTKARQNIFVILLSIFLVLYALVSFVTLLIESGSLSLPGSLEGPTLALTGLAGIFAGLSVFRIKEIPKSFGFVALAIFLVLNGLIFELFALNPSSPSYHFLVPAMMALLAGAFFVSRKETWKNFSYIALSGYLIFVSSIYFGLGEFLGTTIFSMITIIFAFLAAIFFVLRK